MRYWYFASYRSLAYKKSLSISDYWFIVLSNIFVFSDPEPSKKKKKKKLLVLRIDQEFASSGDCQFSFVKSSKLITIFNFSFIRILTNLLSHSFSTCAISTCTPSKIFSLFSSLALNAILLTFSVNLFCASVLNLCYDFNNVQSNKFFHYSSTEFVFH